MIVPILFLHRDDWKGKSPRIYYQILIQLFSSFFLKYQQKINNYSRNQLNAEWDSNQTITQILNKFVQST